MGEALESLPASELPGTSDTGRSETQWHIIDYSDPDIELPIAFGDSCFELRYEILSKQYRIILLATLGSALVGGFTYCLLSNSYTRDTANLIIAPIAGLLFTFMVLRDHWRSVRLSDKGIEFVNQFAAELLKRQERTWDDVHSVRLEEYIHSQKQIWFGSKNISTDKFKWSKKGLAVSDFMIVFNFISGGTAHVPLNRLTRAQCRCLFLAIEHWLAQSKLDKKIIKLKHAIISDTTCSSYTDIWMQDLEQRYAITNFVPLKVGQQLNEGAYTVISILSTRGQTAVYLTRNQKGQQIILKEIASNSTSSSNTMTKARELFHRQSEILTKVQHPQVARVVDCFVEAGRDYLALEYIPGKSLRQLVKTSGPPPTKEVVDWLRQLLEILEYLHGHTPPVVHRDLTPDNIVLKPDGSIALIDFGAANEFVGNATGTLVGKQSYISPEQFRGKAEPSSDLYSLGATAFFLITGKDPVPLTELCTPTDVSDSINSKTASPSRTQLDEFIYRCTRFDTNERLASAKEGRDFLRSNLSPEHKRNERTSAH